MGLVLTGCPGSGDDPVKPTPTPTPSPEKYPLELSQTEFTVNVGGTDNITVVAARTLENSHLTAGSNGEKRGNDRER